PLSCASVATTFNPTVLSCPILAVPTASCSLLLGSGACETPGNCVPPFVPHPESSVAISARPNARCAYKLAFTLEPRLYVEEKRPPDVVGNGHVRAVALDERAVLRPCSGVVDVV